MSTMRSTRIVFLVVMLCILIVGFYFFLTRRVGGTTSVAEEDIRPSKVQDVLMKDLSRNYPASPKEVMKYYSELTQCFYNEKYTDADLEALGRKAQELYDDDLIANQGGDGFYLAALKDDVGTFKSSDIVISSYSTGASTDVDYFVQDGRECAGIYCDYTMREGTTLRYTKQLFILRKDSAGHWKILGWQRAVS